MAKKDSNGLAIRIPNYDEPARILPIQEKLTAR